MPATAANPTSPPDRTIAAPLRLHREAVRAEWTDYNGHLNDGYYAVIFSHATDAFLDFAGIDAAYRARSRRTVFTGEMTIRYRREAHAGDEVAVETRLTALDAKRFTLRHVMRHAAAGTVLAECEVLNLSIDATGPKVAPFEAAIHGRLNAISAAHEAAEDEKG
ncbi:thioesterase family protein [Inquilinus limosus]|uniref:thioesterase family protein n=1 Tax=Inquilinus limosus TaxID=171674 RepID=UPI000415CEA5|nr:thioesterase family protein [Inquilinus limosus]